MTLPPALAEPRLLRLWDLLPAARVVGGAVRDELGGRPVADIDLATPLPPAEVIATLEANAIRVIPTGLSHGTVTALIDDRPFEVTTLRRDVATDGRRAVVAFTDDWRQDAARRDFTFNAMSIDRAGALFDYFQGRADLDAGIVRFVGDPDTRIAEDFLRVLRFFRFFARYGRRPPDRPTLEALRRGVAGLPILSPERVWAELFRILSAPGCGDAVVLMEWLGVLTAVVPPPVTLDRFQALLAIGAPADPLLRVAALSQASPEALFDRYRLSTADAERLRWLRGDAPSEQADDLSLRRWLIDVPRSHLLDRTWLRGRSDALRARIAALPDLAFPVQGRDLLAAGMPPGPDIGRRLAELQTIWRESGGAATRERLLAQLAPPRTA